MRKTLYIFNIACELNGNNKEMEVFVLAYNYEMAESTLWTKLNKSGEFRMETFKILEVESKPYIECL